MYVKHIFSLVNIALSFVEICQIGLRAKQIKVQPIYSIKILVKFIGDSSRRFIGQIMLSGWETMKHLIHLLSVSGISRASEQSVVFLSLHTSHPERSSVTVLSK